MRQRITDEDMKGNGKSRKVDGAQNNRGQVGRKTGGGRSKRKTNRNRNKKRKKKEEEEDDDVTKYWKKKM